MIFQVARLEGYIGIDLVPKGTIEAILSEQRLLQVDKDLVIGGEEPLLAKGIGHPQKVPGPVLGPAFHTSRVQESLFEPVAVSEFELAHIIS